MPEHLTDALAGVSWPQGSLTGLAIAVVVFLVLAGARGVVRTRARRFVDAPPTHWDSLIVYVLGSTRTWMLLAVACLVGANNMAVPDGVSTWLTRAVMALFFLQTGLWASRIAQALMERRIARSVAQADGGGATLTVVGFMVRVALWAVVLILILDQLGFNVTTLVASLGIGGVAVALAVQNILGDLFGSLSIALDKPFLIGDFIVVDSVAGTVEHVGLKTTRIRSLTGEQIVVANADLLRSRIHNYKRMDERRIVFGFGVTYGTPAAKLERIPAMVEDIIASQPNARFDRAHLKGFGTSSLDYEVVYYVTVADYARFMDVQQSINLGLIARLGEAGIEFALPTQTLHIATAPPARRATEPAPRGQPFHA